MKKLDLLIKIGIFFIPFTSFYIFPSFYRPISVLFFFIPGFLILLKKISKGSVKIDELLLILYLCLSLIHTFVFIGIIKNDYLRVFNGSIVLVVGVLSYLSIKYYITKYDLDDVIKIIIHAYRFIAFIGVLELLSILNILPGDVKTFVGYIFSAEISSRLQLVTSEPAWASAILIFGIPFFIYNYEKEKSYKSIFYIIVLVILFLFTFSLLGYVCALCILIGYLLLNGKKLFYRLDKQFIIASLSALIIIGGYFVFNIFKEDGGYYIRRIYKFINVDSLNHLMIYDGSAYIRIMYPLVGVYIFINNPWGVGLDGYGLYLPKFIDSIGIGYIPHREVVVDLVTLSGDPKSLYSKILAENGLISGIPIVLFFILVIRRVFHIKKELTGPLLRLIQLNLLTSLVVATQIGTLAYLPMWFSFALIISISNRYKDKEKFNAYYPRLY